MVSDWRTSGDERSSTSSGAMRDMLGLRRGLSLPTAAISKVRQGTKDAVSSFLPETYRFDVHFERVEGSRVGGEKTVLIVERHEVVFCSRPFELVKGFTAEVDEWFQREMTLFRSKNGGEIKEKVFKVALRQGHRDGKTLGKFRIDLSKFVDGHDAENKLVLRLSNGAGSVVLTVTPRFVKDGRREKVISFDANTVYTDDTYETFSDVESLDDGASSEDMAMLEADIDFSEPSDRSFSVEYPPPKRAATYTVVEMAGRASATGKMQRKIVLAKKAVENLEERNAALRAGLNGDDEASKVNYENEVLRRRIEYMQKLMETACDSEEIIEEVAQIKLQVADESSELDRVNLQVIALRRKLRKKNKTMKIRMPKVKVPKVPKYLRMK